MSLFSNRKQTARFEFGNFDGDTTNQNALIFRPSLTVGEFGQIQRNSYQAKFDGSDAAGESVIIPVSQIDSMIAFLEVVVKDWSGPLFTEDTGRVDEEGNPILKPIAYKPNLWREVDLSENLWWMEAAENHMSEIINSRQTKTPKAEPNGSKPDPKA